MISKNKLLSQMRSGETKSLIFGHNEHYYYLLWGVLYQSGLNCHAARKKPLLWMHHKQSNIWAFLSVANSFTPFQCFMFCLKCFVHHNGADLDLQPLDTKNSDYNFQRPFFFLCPVVFDHQEEKGSFPAWEYFLNCEHGRGSIVFRVFYAK